MRGTGLPALLLLLTACSTAGTGSADSGPDGEPDAVDIETALGGDRPEDGLPALLEQCTQGIQPRRAGRSIELLDLASADGTFKLRIAREPGDGSAIGETYPFDLVRFALVSNDTQFCLTSSSDMTYQWGHHNWYEIGKARHANVEYVLRLELQGFDPFVWKDTLEAHPAGSDALLWGPIPLHTIGCRSIPPGDLNYCFQRERQDR